jgi:hypothetical protein
MLNIPGVKRIGGLEQHHFHLVLGHGAVFNTARNHEELAFMKLDRMIAKFDSKASTPCQKELVGVGVAMPDKLTLELDEFDFLAVYLGYDFWPPMFRNL